MKPTIKAAFFDVDATMYSHAVHDIVPSTRSALTMLHELGIKVGVATSRCRYEMANMPSFFRTFPFSAIISDGGALAMAGNQVIEKRCIHPTVVQRVLDFAKKHERTIRYSTVDGDYFAYPPKQIDKDIFFLLYLNAPIYKPYEGDEVLNILLYIKDAQEREALISVLEGTSIVDHGPVIEINCGQIDKSDGIYALAKHWGIEMNEILSMGDGANDVGLLQACGIGVAMGNGCDAVKEVADFVTKRIEEDGLSYALQHYGLIPVEAE